MGSSMWALKSKLLEIYPELDRRDISMSLHFDRDREAWVLGISKGDHKLRTFLESRDADSCLEGHVCVPLGVKIGEFLDNFAK